MNKQCWLCQNVLLNVWGWVRSVVGRSERDGPSKAHRGIHTVEQKRSAHPSPPLIIFFHHNKTEGAFFSPTSFFLAFLWSRSWDGPLLYEWLTDCGHMQNRDGEVPSQKELSSYFEELICSKVPHQKELSSPNEELFPNPGTLPGIDRSLPLKMWRRRACN